VVERLKAGLAELLSAFKLYLSDVGLGIVELREASHAAEKRSLIPEETVPKHETRGVAADESTNATQKQATKSRVEQDRREEDHSNGATRSGSHRGGGSGGGMKAPSLRSKSQSKSRRDWNGRGNMNGTAFAPQEMEMVQ
jgi:hypothetical protein